MKLGLLGPLEVVGPGGAARIAGAKERLVLALLAIRRNEVVARDALVDALWGDDPPATAVKTLQGHVARVRRALEPAGVAGVLKTRDPGYLLSVPAGSIDVAGFEGHAAAGRRALIDGDATRATAELGRALQLWRGEALADCRWGGWAPAEAVRLDELRLSTVEDRIDGDMMLGRHGVLVAELESLVARHPLRERLWAALMLALYRAGRQADALRAYQRARDLLIRELGLEPGVELRQLEAAVLGGDPALDAPDAVRGTTSVERATDPAIALPGRLAIASSAVFVGRAHERERLDASFKAVETGERRVVLLSGEPGIGKTSLSAAFGQGASEDGAVVLYGRCDEDLGIPYQPWAEVLAHIVGHAPQDLLAEHVDARGSVLARLAPELASRATVGDTPSSDAESERHLLFGAVVDLLSRISARAPLVLVLDDLHWADRPTVQLLLRVVTANDPLRLLVIGTFRDSDLGTDHPFAGALASLHRERGVERVQLRGLGDDELGMLLEKTAGHELSADGVALRDALSAETDGNPFFVGEMFRHLAETGVIYHEHGRWVASPDLRTSGLPVSVREVIGRRVARLGAPTRGALSQAAVIGREFDIEVLALVTEVDQEQLIGLCDEAVDAAVLTGSAVPGRYMFTHALIEHALYDALSSGRRSLAHRAVAEALEKLCGDHPGDRVGQLAHHWAQTTQPPDADKAIAYAQLAGDRALALLAPDEALRWYGQALDLSERAPTDDAGRRAALLLGFGDAQRQTGDPAHRETLLAAGRLADDVGAVEVLAATVLRNNRGFNSNMGTVDRDRVEMSQRALDRLGDGDNPDRARLLALLCVEGIWDADLDERLSMANQAVGIARRIGDRAALVDAISLCQEAITMPQTLELRRRWLADACELADDLGDPIVRLHVNLQRYLTALEAGDLVTMREAYAIFESESERVGQPANRWQIAYHQASQRTLGGDLEAAEQAANEALALGTAAGYPADAVTVYGGQLLTLRWMQGRLQEVVPLVEQAMHDNPGLRIFRATLGAAMSFDEPADEVRKLLDTEMTDRFLVSDDASWLGAQVLWAIAVTRSGHRPGAELLYQRLLPWSDQFVSTHVTVNGGVSHYLGMLAHALGERDAADRWFATAVTFHEVMDAPYFVASSQAAWAGLLLDRDRPGDRARARALVGAALPVATERGYGFVEREALAALAALE